MNTSLNIYDEREVNNNSKLEGEAKLWLHVRLHVVNENFIV